MPSFDFVKGDCAVGSAILGKRGYNLSSIQSMVRFHVKPTVVGFVMRWLKMISSWFFHELAQNASSSSLHMQHISISSHVFTFRIEPNMKSFSHAKNIILRRDI